MKYNREEILHLLAAMDEYQFEHLIADLWEGQGWNTRVTSSSNDRGIDVIAERGSPFYQKQLIQAKCFSRNNTVGSPDIQQYSSLRHQEENVDAVVVVTTSSFSRQAKEIANDLNVKLVDGHTLYEMVSEYGGENLLEQYISLPSSNDAVGKKSEKESSPSVDVTIDRESSEGAYGGNREVTLDDLDWKDSDDDRSSSSGDSGFKTILTILARKIGPRQNAGKPPYKIPESVYHNKNWRMIKLAFGLPILLFIGYFIAAFFREFYIGPYEEITLSSTPELSIIILLWLISVAAAPFLFIIYASRDKKLIYDETGQGSPRHPLTIAAFSYFSVGLYILWYLYARVKLYEVGENSWVELDSGDTTVNEQESEESTQDTSEPRFPDSHFFED